MSLTEDEVHSGGLIAWMDLWMQKKAVTAQARRPRTNLLHNLKDRACTEN